MLSLSNATLFISQRDFLAYNDRETDSVSSQTNRYWIIADIQVLDHRGQTGTGSSQTYRCWITADKQVLDYRTQTGAVSSQTNYSNKISGMIQRKFPSNY